MTGAHGTHTQALPTPGAGARMLHVPISSVARSLTNPRKHFNPVTLQELADSIAATGVNQPILLRPLPAHRLEDTHRDARAQKQPLPEYELVAGERRWRACQLAGVAEVPAMIRPLTDAQALEIQIIENLQREDISRLEEAEGYRVLLDETGQTAEELGAKVGKGKSRAYIYSVLKILDLCDEGRQAMREGKLDFSCGLPIARIPNHQLQLKALERATDPNKGWNGDRMSAREVQRMVQTDFTTKLEYARFDREDASLCPTAGACSTCPNRSGIVQSDDRPSANRADVCTNPPCFKAKEEAHAVRVRKQAEDMGCNIITGREAKALMPGYQNVEGHLRLDASGDSPVKGKTLRAVIGPVMEQAGIKPTLVENPHTKEFVAVLRPEQASELLAMAGAIEAQTQVQEDLERSAKAHEEAAKRDATTAYERAWRREVLARIAQHMATPSEAALLLSTRLAALSVTNTINTEPAKELCKLLDLGKVAPVAALQDMAKTMANPIILAGLVIAQRDADYSPVYWEACKDVRPNARMLDMAAACGVDVDAVKAQVQANMRAAATVSTAAPKADSPLPSAARAGADGKGGKAKNSKRPAARAAEGAEKLSAATATASIAAALQALPGDAVPGAAAAAQGNEAGPVAADAAQAPAPLVTLKRSKLAAPSADTPASGVQAQSADDGQGGANVQTGAAAVKTWTPEELLANRVIVLPNATGKGQRIYIGDEGTVVAIIGDTAVDVSFPGPKGCKPVRVAFDVSELELSE